MLAEQHLRNLLPTTLMKSMAGFFEQANRNLAPHSTTGKGHAWLSKVRVVSTTQPLLPPKIMPGVFETVSKALYEDRWLNVTYANAAGKQTTANVMPLGMAQQGTRLYLVCRFEGFEDERILALNRITSARASTLPFDRPKEFDLEKYDADGKFGFGEGKRIRLSFRIDKSAGQHLLETPLSQDQKVKEFDSRLQIVATVVDTAQLDRWLRGFGEQISHIRKKVI